MYRKLLRIGMLKVIDIEDFKANIKSSELIRYPKTNATDLQSSPLIPLIIVFSWEDAVIGSGLLGKHLTDLNCIWLEDANVLGINVLMY